MKIVASIEARLGSSRLPGKVLKKINGYACLELIYRRLEQSKLIDDIIIATSKNPLDDDIESWCLKKGFKVFRGSEDDVLSRVVSAHEACSSDVIVEITGDCPLTDHNLIDEGIKIYQNEDFDVVSNCRQPSYPQGADVQVFSLEILKHVEQTIFDEAVREHVSLYFYENEDIYKIYHMHAPKELNGPNIRLQLDYEEDYQFIISIYNHLYPKYGLKFGVKEIIKLLSEKNLNYF